MSRFMLPICQTKDSKNPMNSMALSNLEVKKKSPCLGAGASRRGRDRFVLCIISDALLAIISS